MEIIYQEGPSVLWKRAQNRPQWNATDRVVDQWLNTRQELLVHYHSLAKQPSFHNKDVDLQENIQEFCTVLMDYLSQGHFSVFEQLAAVQELYKPSAEPNKVLWDNLLTTTDKLVTFNDKYSETVSTDSLHADLSSVGEQIAHRLELEDQFMHHYITATYTMSEKNYPVSFLYNNSRPAA